MSKKMNFYLVGLLMAISFVMGTVFAPGPASSGSFGTCAGGCWNIHQAGFCGVKLDNGLKLTKVEQVRDHSIYIWIAKK